MGRFRSIVSASEGKIGRMSQLSSRSTIYHEFGSKTTQPDPQKIHESREHPGNWEWNRSLKATLSRSHSPARVLGNARDYTPPNERRLQERGGIEAGFQAR